MERYDKILTEINVSTNDLETKSIQDVLKLAKEKSNSNTEFWNHISDILWAHLQTGFSKIDDQLLSATCFYTVIPLSEKQQFYLTELLNITNKELFIKKGNGESTRSFHVVSMMYGMFQSTFLLQKNYNDVSKITSIFKPLFDLLLLMGYEYSKYTFISFKTIKLFKKVIGTDLQQYIFNKENQIKLLNFVNHNWENPVTGIRDLNRSIFQTIISTLDHDMYATLLVEINSYYWNKAKYLMLSEIVEHQNGSLFCLIHDNKLVDGLIHSLYKPGLVSAGADMYFALLKQINFDHDWCKIFQCGIIQVLNGSNRKAIENFKNFWCLTTMKKFPSLSNILLEELKYLGDSELNLYSQLCIMKQANKLGIIEKQWKSSTDLNQIQKAVLNGIEHCNYNIRMAAFDIICVSRKKFIQSQLEFGLILNFLNNNVNSDCTVLRLSMLNSFNHFLIQIHSIFLNDMIKDENSEELQHLLDFFKKLQCFIVASINFNGNYQRMITSVKLCNILLTCLSEIPKNKREQTRHSNRTLIDYIKEKKCWLLSTEEFVLKLVSLLNEPSDDIRESVMKVLLNHYCVELTSPNVMKHLVSDALKSMKSKFFYEISCGQSMFKLLTHLVMKEENSITEYKNVEDIFYFGYNDLITEHKAQTNIMKSIETGKQLHSFMSILIVVLETCISSSYKIDIHSIMVEFVDILEIISNQFSWEEESTKSSDFSKINDMVENIILNSGYDNINESNQMKISGLHQIVLNSLWLNVKASCDLVSILVQYNVNDSSMCKKCLNIITHVLETSRHKGAIETAGASLGRGIQFLTSLPEEIEASEVPFSLLECKLNDLISETNKMSSITRRGAGLSIMVHRIVSSDMKRGKPLFHYFINTLLQLICTTTENSYKTNDKDKENQIDLPKAIYIHFMTRIATDSSLASDMMFYLAKLAELAFVNLTSPHWQIRNAALQLYGALIPKQIGEKKVSGSDDETTATVAFDELRTHSPKLWKFIMEQLKQSIKTDKVQTHSNLVPILNLLANSAKRYNFSYDMAEQNTVDQELFFHLVMLLNSPIHTVRRLTAKCIFNIFQFKKIYNALVNHDCLSENFLHGSLILLNVCHKYYYYQLYEENFKNLRDRFRRILCSRNHSYLSKRLFEDIDNNDIKFEGIEKTISEMKSNAHLPGAHLWAETRIKKYVNTCTWNEIPAILNILLWQSDYEKYCEFVLLKIKAHDIIPTAILFDVVSILLSFEQKYFSSVIWRVLFETSLKANLAGCLDTAELLKNVEERESLYTLRYIVPLVARNIANVEYENKLSLMKIINKLSDFENSDIDLRYTAAIANNELANVFDKLPDSMKVTSIKCAVILLQDEDEDVRNLSVNFYSRLSNQKAIVQPYICLNNILNRQFLYTLFTESQYLIQLVKELSELLQLNHSIDEYNPFANDSKNIYHEPYVLKKLIENLMFN